MSLHRVDFSSLKRPRTPNTFLMAPEGFCKQARADMPSPIYVAAAPKLRHELLSIIIAEPRVAHTLADEAGLYDDFVVRSALFRFPDLISVQVIDAGGGKSTLALYSRSVYGRSDLGVNRRRSLGWIERLGEAIKPVKS